MRTAYSPSENECNTPPKTNRPPNLQNCPPPTFTHTIRRLLHLGHSLAITIPTAWAETNLPKGARYLEIDVATPGILIVRPLPLHKDLTDDS